MFHKIIINIYVLIFSIVLFQSHVTCARFTVGLNSTNGKLIFLNSGGQPRFSDQCLDQIYSRQNNCDREVERKWGYIRDEEKTIRDMCCIGWDKFQCFTSVTNFRCTPYEQQALANFYENQMREIEIYWCKAYPRHSDRCSRNYYDNSGLITSSSSLHLFFIAILIGLSFIQTS